MARLLLVFALLACQNVSPTSEQQAFIDFWQTQTEIDLWIKGGEVLDGTGTAAYPADLLITGERIVYVGWVDSSQVQAKQTFDARGLTVSPGLVDAHVHGNPAQTPDFSNFLAQGVTTICLGQDGSSPGTVKLTRLLQQGPSHTAPNLAYWLGHGTLREESGVGFAPQASPVQQTQMEQRLQKVLAAGAFGLSTGLEYTPGMYAPAAELEGLAKIVGQYDGLIMSHLRNEDDEQLFASIDELLQQGQHCRVHISHLKSVYGQGTERAEEILAYLQSARDRGIELTADLYPYAASFTTIGIVFPDWARPPHDYAQVVRQRKEELRTYLRNRVNQRNGPAATLIGSGPYAGKTLEAVAKEKGQPFENILLEIGPTGASAAYFVMDPVLQQNLASWPWLMFSSDGSPTMRHPRGYGSFARVLGEWTGEVLPLAEAIRKMTQLPAQTIGLVDRGQLKAGFYADVIVFDPDSIVAKATFAEPHQWARGMKAVWVNGSNVWEKDQFSQQFPGQIVKRGKP